MSVHERSAGRFEVKVYAGYVNGRSRYISRTVYGTARDARRVEAKLKVEVDEGRHERLSDDPALGDLLDRWVEWAEPVRRWSPAGTRNRKSMIRRRIKPAVGEIRLSRLRAHDLDRFYGALLGEGLSPATVLTYHRLLHAALEQAVRWELIASNPAGRATPPAAQSTPVRPPGPKVVGVLIARARAADEAFGLFVRLAAVTGARRSQLCALRWGDVDLDAGVATFRRRIVDGGGQVVELDGTKSRAEYRIALDEATVSELRAQRRRAVEAELACSPRSTSGRNGFVFSHDPLGRRPWRPDNVSARWGRLRAKVPGAAGVRLHDLRHWCATTATAGGFDPRTVADRIGHANPNQTLGRYSHRLDDVDRRLADYLAAELS